MLAGICTGDAASVEEASVDMEEGDTRAAAAAAVAEMVGGDEVAAAVDDRGGGGGSREARARDVEVARWCCAPVAKVVAVVR